MPNLRITREAARLLCRERGVLLGDYISTVHTLEPYAYDGKPGIVLGHLNRWMAIQG